MCSRRIPSVRISPDNETVLQQLGLIADLAGNWHGEGFNLVARPFLVCPQPRRPTHLQPYHRQTFFLNSI